jgi:mediator of RNA polymerase II transcription subunit 16
MHTVAAKTDNGYRYEMGQLIAFGPCHPNPQKSALVSITTNGILRLLWPQGDQKWYESTSEIESVVSSDDMITHASICADRSCTPIFFILIYTNLF